MKPHRPLCWPIVLATIAAACAEARSTTAIHTTTPQATRSATAVPSPAGTSRPTDLPSPSPTPTLPSSALPVCQQPSQVELSELTIAFAADWDGDGEIYKIQGDGSGLIQLTDNTTDETGANWSPDGRQLAFVSDLDRTPKYVVSDANGSNPATIASGAEISYDVVWSPTGQQIVFRRGNDLVSVDVQTGEEVNLTPRRPFLVAFLPDFSPEGDRMVMTVSMPDSAGPPEWRLFTVRADGTELTELSFPAGDVGYWPMWHPVKDEILFQAVVQGEGYGLYVAILDGSITMLKAEQRYLSFPSWSPDGTMIAYVALESEPGTWLHVATENEDVDERVLDPKVGGEEGLGIYRYYWAPDSRHIAYTVTNADRGFGTADIFVFDICEGQPWMVVEAVSQFSDLSWRPLP